MAADTDHFYHGCHGYTQINADQCLSAPISGSQSGLVNQGSALIVADFSPRITRMNADEEQLIRVYPVICGKENFPYPPLAFISACPP